MRLSKKEVEHVANLARLTLTEEEVALFTEQLSSILDFAQKLNELDTEHVKPTSHALNITNVFREDEVIESISREYALKNAPDQKDGQFKVPSILEG
ncbi:Asp-tRNA(Asn)/Glu-tRNA(Gln) amidotransferase subunit GatC [Tepidibacillus fermentans]|uniref:Aspartyl/glutamyl-tRNA(Asn/Gln) amidotransferase subunit C n=1 Tax=Tepidibacillus fermentans TaxID=1281767 RepID=A0A4R3KBX8_9BACI|nr:Asp-tRNA(Asn)/Glu-tRNA(Gln) amidotransferase subunit GatC [Tepidibacillus fermentans]TCS80588.1 aspartyl/glutamyl-tRNA(Asn/Gln) amidotransferase subunit C [Tepidibacillus fermentans]